MRSSHFSARSSGLSKEIRLRYGGATGLSIDDRGDLVVHTTVGDITNAPPHAYQVIGGRHKTLTARFDLAGGTRYGFDVTGAIDPGRPIVIDPALAYSTYLGGTAVESARNRRVA